MTETLPAPGSSFDPVVAGLADLTASSAVALSLREGNEFVVVAGTDEVGRRWSVDALDGEGLFPVRDEHEQVIACLALTDPGAPDELVAGCVAQARSVVRDALARRDLEEQTGRVNAIRDIIRDAASLEDVDAVIRTITEPLIEAFRLKGIWMRLFESVGTMPLISHSSDEVDMPRDPYLTIASHVLAPLLWDNGHAAIVGEHQLRNAEGTVLPLAHMINFLTRNGLSSMLYVPVGAGSRCFGAITLLRTSDHGLFSESEYAAAVELGHDLGTLLASVRALETEQNLVRELTEIDAYREKLIARVTNELEHPLQTIVDTLSMLGTQASSGSFEPHLLGTIRGDALRMSRLIDNLLLLARLADPDHPLAQRSLDLGPLVRRVCELTEAGIGDRIIDVRTTFEPVEIVGDSTELERMVANLVHNALKFTPADGQVSVSVRAIGSEAEVVIADRGIGIVASELPHIFDEFYRSADPAAQGQPGAGLGLAIVRRVVQRHNGQIEAISTLGQGTTFRVLLPLAATDPAEPIFS